MNSQTSNSQELNLSPKAALILSTITIAAIDGDLNENEITIINRICGSDTSKAWDDAIAVWDVNHVDECVEIITKTLNPKQQRVAVANMVDVAMADGSLDEAENILLRAYTAAFDVSDKDVERIVDVISIKNDKSHF